MAMILQITPELALPERRMPLRCDNTANRILKEPKQIGKIPVRHRSNDIKPKASDAVEKLS